MTRRYILIGAVVVIVVAAAISLTVRHYNARTISAHGRTVVVPGQAEPRGYVATTPTVPTRPAPTPSAPTVPGPPAGAVAAASGYLDARENAIGDQQATPTSWAVAAKPFLTPALFTKLHPPLAPGSPGTGDYAYRVAHQNGWRVAVQADCATDEAAAAPTSTAMTLLCSVTDLTVNNAGTPVPTASLPGAWVLNGAQQQAVLGLRNVAGKWLVSADLTGAPPP